MVGKNHFNTGEVIAGNIGSIKRAKYGVVGHAVNLTSRIEDHTRPGEILVAESTLNSCSLTLTKGRQFDIQPKGLSETVAATAIEQAQVKAIADEEAVVVKADISQTEPKQHESAPLKHAQKQQSPATGKSFNTTNTGEV